MTQTMACNEKTVTHHVITPGCPLAVSTGHREPNPMPPHDKAFKNTPRNNTDDSY